MNLIDAIISKYGHKQGLTTIKTSNGERITEWPYDSPQPKVSELQAIIDEYEPVKLKTDATEEAERLYKKLKSNRFITVDSVEYDLTDSFEFDFQRKAGGNVRVKVKGSKTVTKTKQETDAIENALFTYLNSVADAFDADMTAIESGDYSNSNLKAI